MAIDVLMIGLRNIVGTQGGVESHVHYLAKELDNLGLNVAVSVRSPYSTVGQSLPGTRIKVVRLWAPRSVSAEALVHSFISILYAAATRPRLVHIHAVGPSLLVPLARLLGLRVVATHHGEDYLREKWGRFARFLMRCGELFQARFANSAICVSKSLSERLTKRYGRTFNYIPNGVVTRERQASSNVLTELGLQPKQYIVTVSRFVPEKRHLDLIEAFSRMAIKGIKLVIVGAADHKSAYAQSVIERSKEVDSVILAGFRRGAELEDLFEKSAVFALPSSHEGLPIALLEAMSHGCKIVVSDILPHLDLELPEENYHQVGDPDDLCAKVMGQILNEKGWWHDWSGKLQQYRWDVIALKSLQKYREVDPQIGSAVSMAAPPMATLENS